MKKILSVLLFFPALLQAQEKNMIAPGANLVTQGLPEIPASVSEQMKKYTEFRSASMAAWHPQKTQMIISTRFGNVPQLHLVKMPLGDRKQLTFFDEPVADANYEPLAGNYFLFSRDVGGNEFGQIYRYDIASGHITLLTDGRRSQNGSIRWSRKGDRIAYASTSRNGADRDI